MGSAQDDLKALQDRLEEEERLYAAVLGAMDKVSSLPLPVESRTESEPSLQKVNELWRPPAPAPDGGLLAAVRNQARAAMAPALARQHEFNAALVELLNGRLAALDALEIRLREFLSAVVHYVQRVLPVVDARDRMATALATTRSELILEAFDRRLESMARRLEGLLALRDRLETLSEEVAGLRSGLSGAPPPVRAAAARAADDAPYVAFENRYRGDRDEIRRRLEPYADLFDEGPILDLGCGRGEFLEILAKKGKAALGVESNARVVQECQKRGLDVREADIVEFLSSQGEASLGGIFAAQVAEHLPPAKLVEALRLSHRALRKGGLLILETVNPRSLVAFLEIYNRDLTHERPLHPDTLRFLAAAQGFSDVRIEWRSEVDPSSKLGRVPTEGLPENAASVLNENVERLNALLYGPQEYALLARR